MRSTPPTAPKRDPSGVPSAAEHGKLRAALARFGASSAHVDAAVGVTPAGKTRRAIAAQLTVWARTLPRGS